MYEIGFVKVYVQKIVENLQWYTWIVGVICHVLSMLKKCCSFCITASEQLFDGSAKISIQKLWK